MKLLSIRSILLYILASIIFAVFLIFATGLVDNYRLAKEGVSITGVVTSTNCAQHMSFSYQFTASGKISSGKTSSPDCYSTRAGDTIQVHYLASNPVVNITGNPTYNFRNNLIPIVLASLSLPLFLAFGIWIKKQTKSKKRVRLI
jgi:hypothetical protein